MVSRYLNNLNKLFEESQNNSPTLVGFYNYKGEGAKFGDKVWFYHQTDKEDIRFYFTKETPQKVKLNYLECYENVSDVNLKFLFLYAQVLVSKKISNEYKRDSFDTVRNILDQIGDIQFVDRESILNCYDSILKQQNRSAIFNTFLKWAKDNQLIPSHIPKSYIKQKAKTANDIITAKKEKLPDEKLLTALGAIHFNLIPPDRGSWLLAPTDIKRDQVTAVMSALAMGSPNRAHAEQTVLDVQEISSFTQKVDGRHQTVYYLNWKGSKNYQNNANHILNSMVTPIERSLEYMKLAGISARALATFYSNPNLALKDIILNAESKIVSTKNISLDKPVNMFTLGCLLGFYNSANAYCQVAEYTPKSRPRLGLGFEKLVLDLELDDVVIINAQNVIDMFGIKIGQAQEILGGKAVPLRELQKNWIAHIKNSLKGFPEVSNGTGKGKCDYRHALFALRGSEFFQGKARSYIGSASHFGLVPLNVIGNSFAVDLSSHKNSNIFQRHGFSEEFHLTPHQLRHWHNDLADKRGVTHNVINLWSGRKSPTQLLNYTHRTGSEKSSQISDILFRSYTEPDSDISTKVSLRIKSQSEYEELTKISATKTSTGFCTQNLSLYPCTYLNDFETQCTLCESTCHIAHDKDTVALLNEDLKIQCKRLDKIKENKHKTISKAKSKWLDLHFKNTEILKQLIEILTDDKIRKGSIVRFLPAKNIIRVTDLETKKVNNIVLTLSAPESEFAITVDKRGENNKSLLNELLDLF